MKDLKVKGFLFVSIQLLLFILYFLVPFGPEWHRPLWIKYAALVAAICGLLFSLLAVLQLGRNLSPFPAPVANAKLLQSGLYKKIRHPVYSGLLVFFFGYSISAASPVKFFIALLLLTLFYLKSRHEEKLLIKKFPEYKHYREQTSRFFPFF